MRPDEDASPRIETAIVAANVLSRAGLASLIEKYAYRVVASEESVDKLQQTSLPPPMLVLIAVEAADRLVAQAALCRKYWPDCRIVGIYDYSRSGDDERIRASAANGCVSTTISERALVRLLDLLMKEDGDLFLVLQVRHSSDQRSAGSQPTPPPSETPRDPGASHTQASGTEKPGRKGNGPSAHASEAPGNAPPIAPTYSAPSPRGAPKLSERELQVLDGIVRGLQNKMIARTYGITEATVKVHMKSILRKIQVHNRTQAAVWAMGNDISLCSTLEDRLYREPAEDERPSLS